MTQTAGDGRGRSSLVVRVWLPDRPGALGQVASRIGAVGGDVVGVEVIERGGGRAIDEIAVVVDADRVGLLVREVRAVDGVAIEELRTLPRPPRDPRLAALDLAVRMLAGQTRTGVVDSLCEELAGLVHASWILCTRVADGEILSVIGAAPPLGWLRALGRGLEAEARPAALGERGEGLAWAPLPGRGLVLVIGREAPFTPSEVALVGRVAELAAVRLAELDERVSERPEAAR